METNALRICYPVAAPYSAQIIEKKAEKVTNIAVVKYMAEDRKEYYLNVYEVDKLDAYVVTLGEVKDKALEIATTLRREGLKIDLGYVNKSMKAQIKIALRKNAKYMIIIGEDEVKNGLYQLKNIETQEQVSLSLEDIISRLK